MATTPKKYLSLTPTGQAQTVATVASAGVVNAGDIIALDATGRLDMTVMPVGIGADTSVIAASEGLAAGDWINVWSDAGTAKVRKADATGAGKETDGFVLEAVLSGADATVYFEGTNTQLTGQTPGAVYLQTTAGTGGATAPTGVGNVFQRLGVAVGATAVNFERGTPVTLA